MNKNYSNPPIVEVVCELRASPDSEWDITIPGMIFEKLRDDFPNKEQRIFQEFEQKQEINTIQQQIRSDERAIFFSGDRKTFIQIGNRLLAVNRLKPYISWNEFKPKIEKALNAFYKSTQINKFQRIGLRYINRIEIPGQEVKLENYFNFRPYVGDNLPKKLVSSFIVGCLFPFFDGRDICKIELSNVIPDNKDNSAFLLDIDYFYFLDHNSAILINEILEWIESAHQNIEEMFIACITDQLKESFQEAK
jgi:uncharacterized protein (TIGR04255 family)